MGCHGHAAPAKETHQVNHYNGHHLNSLYMLKSPRLTKMTYRETQHRASWIGSRRGCSLRISFWQVKVLPSTNKSR